MNKSKNGKKGAKAPVAEPAVGVEQKPETEVTAQAKPQGEAGLNEAEGLKLNEFERIIEQNLSGFMLVGRALKAIQDEKLYRGKFTKFTDYCHERWGLSDKHAYRLMDAYTCVDKLQKELVSPIGEIRFPVNESQVRPLMALDPEKWVKAWQRVLKACKGKPITAVEVEEVVNKMLGKPGKKDTAQPKTSAKKAEQKLVKIGNLVTKALKEDFSKLSVAGLKQVLVEIQKMIETNE